MPEARELNSFLLSVATEVDTVFDPLLRELDRRADAMRVGHAALDPPCLANEAPTELPKNNNDRLLRFLTWLSRNKEVAIAMIRYCGSGMIGLCGGSSR